LKKREMKMDLCYLWSIVKQNIVDKFSIMKDEH
jgi:hypothetical protein